MNNLLNEISFVEYKSSSLLQMKQGDLTPIYVELTGAKKSLKNTNQELAQLILINSDNNVSYKEEVQVNQGRLYFQIKETLPVGRYYIEVKHEGRIYPSTNTHGIQINASASI
ncbi:hypothetical protein K0O13_07660 [Mammaliicoccus sciuri]|uniref:hypothetical protein n=1 Tax=Mammaliicoccus sciuri TaxID=1296 RepID=UPI001C62995F|nr:hypothetical protein [Mammaliicoccus sciuri]QYG29977.1 hypothetical protein K0O13_07660 [Mammaliicoccus sciuri]